MFYINFCNSWRKYLHSTTPSEPQVCFTTSTDGGWVSFENLLLCPKPRWWPSPDLSPGGSSTVSLLPTELAHLLSLTPRPPLTLLKLQTHTELHTERVTVHFPNLRSNGHLSSRSQYFLQQTSQNQKVKLLCCQKSCIIL